MEQHQWEISEGPNFDAPFGFSLTDGSNVRVIPNPSGSPREGPPQWIGLLLGDDIRDGQAMIPLAVEIEVELGELLVRLLHTVDEEHEQDEEDEESPFRMGVSEIHVSRTDGGPMFVADDLEVVINRGQEIVDCALAEAARWWYRRPPSALRKDFDPNQTGDQLDSIWEADRRRTRRPGRRGPDLETLKRAKELYDPERGMTFAKLAEMFKVSESTAHRWVRRAEERGL